MQSIVCTMFEGHYAIGAAAFANSLSANAFRGQIVMGYRGELPGWIKQLKEVDPTRSEYQIAGMSIRFIPLDSVTIHLTNYKPDFMLQIFDLYPNVDVVFYFDPDIFVKCCWSFFEEWAISGVSMVEDVNSPMYSTHPIRNKWRTYFAKFQRKLHRPIDVT